MAKSVITNPNLISGNYISNPDYWYRKSGNVVTVCLTGRVSINYDTGHINNVYLPNGFRPPYDCYFMVSSGGAYVEQYLACIHPDGTILIYHRDSQMSYLYGSVTFIIT